MTLPKELITVTRLSKTIALVLFITLPIATFFFGMKYQEMVDASKQTNTMINDRLYPSPSPVVINNINEKELCDFTIKLPASYYYEEPINSFFGFADTKSQKGKMCKVILGPHYKLEFEGFSGEQIQINVYPTALTSIAEISEHVNQGNKTDDYLPIHAYQFTRPSYGGEDNVLVFENNLRIYQIIWRNETYNLDNLVKQIVSQL